MAGELAKLFCAAAPKIGIIESACEGRSRPKLIAEIENWCRASRVWIIKNEIHLQGMLVLREDEDEFEIWYVIVAQACREKGLGKCLVKHIQTLQGSLKAEARNDESRAMLRSCSFEHNGEMSSPKFPWDAPQPIYRWSR